MTVQVVLGICCSQMSGPCSQCQRQDCMTIQIALGLCFLQISETRLHDCAGCYGALLFTNVRD